MFLTSIEVYLTYGKIVSNDEFFFVHSESTGVVANTNNFVSGNDNKQQQDSLAGQLIDFSLGATVDPVNFNNNSLLNTSATLVTSDSHEHKGN